MSGNSVFQAFEHASYNTKNEGMEGKLLPVDLFEALKNYAGEKELPYYTITANGIRFAQYVGALQVGRFCVEILPKIDRYSKSAESAQRVLIEMLRQSGFLNVKSPTESSLRIKQNFILETYVQMFLKETWQLIHEGLIKTYRSEEGNKFALKGNLIFNKHIQENNIHAERFYVRYTTYDREHPLNRVLYKTLKLICNLDIGMETLSGAKVQLAYFPELGEIAISDEFFQKIEWNRKSEAYKKAINIARLLLLNYHPDLSHGKNNVLALMFDMNEIWEGWFTKRLSIAAQKYNGSINIRAQAKETFWIGSTGESVRQKPDIIIDINQEPRFILDTKWKIINNRPSEDDIRQMFAYNKLFGTRLAYLVYPGENRSVHGEFYNSNENGACGLRFIFFLKDGKLCHSAIDAFLDELVNIDHINHISKI